MFYFHFETVAQRTQGIESFGTTKENNKVNVPTALRFKPINKLQNLAWNHIKVAKWIYDNFSCSTF